MIGGIDITIAAPAKARAADVIVGRMREFWPDGYFQDADSVAAFSLFDPWVSLVGTSRKEFFIYRDAYAAAEWEAAGATAENSNTMLHFFVGNLVAHDPEVQQVTIVCDEVTQEIQSLVKDLEYTFCPSLMRLAA
jgi:hypothetical protein